MTPAELKQARARLALSQAAIAKILRIPKRTYQRYEAEGVSSARPIPDLVAAVVGWMIEGKPPH